MEWHAPWKAVPNDEIAHKLQSELVKELAPGHPLFGLSVSAIGLGEDSDDIAFKLMDGSCRFAVVHLTWRMQPESPPWPYTILFADERDFVIRGMQADQQEL